MQTHTICHCGKCQVKCNKHNKRAKCADCGKRRMLGTVIEKGEIRHICNECCALHEQKLKDEAERQIMADIRKTQKKEEEMWNNPLIP